MMKHTAALKAPVTLEEILNAVTHGVGAALAVAALIGMLVYYADGGVWHTTSCLVYGISLILLYLASTLYHSFTNLKVKSVFKVIDHAAIFVLIAGNYTPFALIPLHGSFGWTIFGLVWGMALVGIVIQCIAAKRFRNVRTMRNRFAAIHWKSMPTSAMPQTRPNMVQPKLPCSGISANGV
ncbi:PAQR family membrane homeostasis protein TrhA [Mitsuokella multacida]|uniref:PAQR family membrane homeostasis protein TrhA n=1 Tax=Mitsuokella multacida TaxID=52226 RepID=UPI003FF04C29